MATVAGPDVMGDHIMVDSLHSTVAPITIDNMAGAPRHSALNADLEPLSQLTPPPPNPPFTFPARPTSSAPSSLSRRSERHTRSVYELLDRPSEKMLEPNPEKNVKSSRASALPVFNFNPGASLPPVPPIMDNTFLLNPPLSPQSPRMAPNRASGHGHRRGGSEFVGGNIRAGDAIAVMGTSPTKSESGFASPKLSPAPPPGRRGHRHQRSGAVSMTSQDIAKMMQSPQPNSGVQGNSAPASPAVELNGNFSFPRNRQAPTPALLDIPPPSKDEEKFVPIEDKPVNKLGVTDRPANRARVGFSDTLEYIPRPLSMVSSETSSTITARPGHSVSGSISSIITSTPSPSPGIEWERTSPSPVENCNIERRNSRVQTDSRPSTAGAVLERTQSLQPEDQTGVSPKRRNSIPLLAALPEPGTLSTDTPSPGKTPKRWSFFGLESFPGSHSPVRSRPVSCSSSDQDTKEGTSAIASSENGSDTREIPEQEAVVQQPTPKKSGKKKRKVKSWAGTILTRKSKARNAKKTRRTPTPPATFNRDVEDEEEYDDLPVAASEPITPTVMIIESSTDGGTESWKPPRPASIPDEDMSFPMIDLDAALGPFNTPLPRNPEWEAAQKAGGFTKRQLHSAAGMSRFTGPGMHYQHRRAESAPEMPPFEGRHTISRFGSSSTMADVFEEEEEEQEWEEDDELQAPEMGGGSFQTITRDDRNSDRQNSPPASTAVEPVEGAVVQEIPAHSLKRKGSDSISVERYPPTDSLSSGSIYEDAITEDPSAQRLQVVDSGFDFGLNSNDSATPSPRRIIRNKDLAPVDVSPLQLPTTALTPVSPFSMTHSSASAFPSPRSAISYDANRISTAPSSITEDNFQSLLLGEPGPEVIRISMDDIPSLTSSNSTMTRESAFAQAAAQMRRPPNRGERPQSFTSAAFGRRRSSLASLSRLISTSHGERSKLSMEVTLDSEPEKKQAKPSKTKRFSRMVQFWKPKEGSNAP